MENNLGIGNIFNNRVVLCSFYFGILYLYLLCLCVTVYPLSYLKGKKEKNIMNTISFDAIHQHHKIHTWFLQESAWQTSQNRVQNGYKKSETGMSNK